ncbi:hypothetical protein CORC01_13892 [Colletotrichum orchidophilum]|uniref:Uncharacterized protein n=1 Tax=Colletotrichum orchidophilum TaxID=1209926 RepID=A0A1G4ANQ1_9PEZI|nr:uncharacterized protein CORC01_13892 [Colletotrichum orchidophilum]OHE90818.1 hypothetical protein CORC01_13892 [Colletotrichum orchidophilum]
MCWEKQIIYTDCHHSVFEDLDCTNWKMRQRDHSSSFNSSQHSVRKDQQYKSHDNDRPQKRKSSWMVLVCPFFAFMSTPAPEKEASGSGACRGRKRCANPVSGKCPRCVQDQAVAAAKNQGMAVPVTPTRRQRPDGAAAATVSLRRQGFMADENLCVEGRLSGVTNDAYGASGDRQASQRSTTRRYQNSGSWGAPRGGYYNGNGPRRDIGDDGGGDGGGGGAALGSSSQKSPTSPWHNNRFHEARKQEARQQCRRPEQQGAQQADRHQQPQDQRIPVGHDRQQQQQQQQQQESSGSTAHLPTQPQPPLYVRGPTLHLVPRPLKITKKTNNTSRAVTAEGSGGLARSTASASRPQQPYVANERGQRSSRGQQDGRTVVSPEPHIKGVGFPPELPLEELIDEVEMLWRRA